MKESSYPYVLPLERQKLQEEVVTQVIDLIDGPVSLYEEWPGQEPHLFIYKKAKSTSREYCALIGNDDYRRRKCRQNYEARVKSEEPGLWLCWAGVHNLACAVETSDSCVTFIGGEFHYNQEIEEAEKIFIQFLEDEKVIGEEREIFIKAWNGIPSKDSVDIDQMMQDLTRAGKSYLFSLRQLSQFRYSVDLVSHDLVILLQSLIAEVETLQIELKRTFNMGKAWMKRFDDIIQSCQRYQAYLEARLGVIRNPTYSIEPLASLLYECIDLYEGKARKIGIEFHVALEKIKDDSVTRVPRIYMERSYLNRAFHNVIDNAVKYSYRGRGGDTRCINIIGRLKSLGGIPGYEIEISNLGIGIEKDELDKVFEPGYQGRLRKGELRPGFGMGLPFAKECIEEIHKGKITITSQNMNAAWLTTLTIWLPINPPIKDQ